MMASRIDVALLHSPVLNRKGETATTAITPMDVHDFSRTAAFYDVEHVYLIHPAKGMESMVNDLTGYWKRGEGGQRNQGRREVLKSVQVLASLEDAQAQYDYQLWFTSAQAMDGVTVLPADLPKMTGNHLIVFGTAWGLDVKNLPRANGWLSPIVGIGKVRHLSVRAALAIYLDRLCMS
ncbi:MAG: RNA methyltransferase [Mariprofundaceae bacterium]|nr:RNA methyltransferase [Mariprofundaceae bacterium]